MKKKKTLLIALSTALSLMCFTIVAIGKDYSNTNINTRAAKQYGIVMNSTTNKMHTYTDATYRSGSATIKTLMNNDVVFNYSNLSYLANGWHTFKKNGYIANSYNNPIYGLKSITVTTVEQSGRFAVYFGGFSIEEDVNTFDFNNNGFTFNFYNKSPRYFKLTALKTALSVTSISLELECHNYYYTLGVFNEDPNKGSISYPLHPKSGTEVTVRATPKENYGFEGWYDEQGQLVTTDNPYVFTMPEHDVTLNARFVDNLVYQYDYPSAGWCVLTGLVDRNITSVSVPATVTYNNTTYNVNTIAGNAFSGCSKLTNITVASGLRNIQPSAFSGCSSLKKLTIPFPCNNSPSYQFFGAYFGATSYSQNYNCVPHTLEEVVISNNSGTNKPYISNYCFYRCVDIRKIVLDTTRISSIGDYAFYMCSKLYDFQMSDGITSIGKEAFEMCYSLKTIRLPSSLETIGDSAFGYCYSLIEALNESSLSNLGLIRNYAKNIITNEADSKISKNGLYLMYTDDAEKYVLAYTSTSPAYITIPSGTTQVYKYAFYGLETNSLNIPNTVKIIGDKAFYQTHAPNFTIPTSVVEIGEEAFFGCDLTSVTLSDSIKRISNRCFGDNPNLSSFTIGHGDNLIIGPNVFYHCTSLTTVNYNGTMAEWNSSAIYKNEEWTSYSSLTTVHCTDGDIAI